MASARTKATRRAGSGEEGVVFTKPIVAELILDLVGYIPTKRLTDNRLLEPACGHGVFLSLALHRLLRSARIHRHEMSFENLRDCLRGFDIDEGHVRETRSILQGQLVDYGVSEEVACYLVETWIKKADFLLEPGLGLFDFVVGNPPYVSLVRVPPDTQERYRSLHATLAGRTDLYVAFIERGLSLLSPHGRLGFICSNRWTSLAYGRRFRELVSDQFRVHDYVDMKNAQPFEQNVSTYTSVFILGRGTSKDVPVFWMQGYSPDQVASVAMQASGQSLHAEGVASAIYPSWFDGDEPWSIIEPEQINILRDLEARFAPIDETCEVGMGPATGLDEVYVTEKPPPVEASRILPLVMPENIDRGRLVGNTKYLVNTFEDNGQVVDLALYPRTDAYLRANEVRLRARHVAKKRPDHWFRTINKIDSRLAGRDKLLAPLVCKSPLFAVDRGVAYHSGRVTYITSDAWNIDVLAGLLSSRVAHFFLWAYAPQVRGGYMECTPQTLRRIRLPDPIHLHPTLTSSIERAFHELNFDMLDYLAAKAYGLDSVPAFDMPDERTLFSVKRRAFVVF